MNDPNFTLADLAERFGLAIHGDPGTRIDGVATLASAGPTQLGFLANPRYGRQVASSRAGALVVTPALASGLGRPALASDNPAATFARIAGLFERPPPAPPGIHGSAVVDPGAEVDASASIGPLCTVAAGARIAAGAVLGPQCSVGPDCVVGEDSRLVARVTLVARVVLGRRVIVHPGAVIGADGFGLAIDRGAWLKVPQLGGVRIGDDCEIGANTTIDRGALDDTVLEEDVRLDNQVQIAHNVRIGAHTAMAGCSAVAGSTRIGRWCLVGGAAGIAGHLELCDRVTVLAMSMVSHSISEPGEYASGIPAQDSRQWRRNAARLRKLDQLVRRLGRDDKDQDQ
ncbi:MAG: UDP-3-O-(3-hydroxymyristoyl)glucosamine N-acyltransferase [Xanthomonadales bacterium]|nr:UDP-3-O-(3-hydroxymyristoyl)glucosamine N-acyltransferase [Xanthomonadales bacterium]